MSVATASKRYLLAQAAVRAGALMHLVSQRDTGLLNPLCGAHPVRSREIHTWDRTPADLSALCGDCAALAAGLPGVDTVEQGLTVFVGGNVTAAAVRLIEVPVDSIRSSGDLREPGEDLITSVSRNGVVVPILARRTPGGLVLIDGGRRLAAARAAGDETVPVLVRDVDDEQAVIEQLLANLHRQDLDPIAQARAYVAALEQLGLTKEGLADGLGISRPAVSNTIRLLALPEHLREHIAAGRMTAAHGRALLRLNGDPASQDELADAILAGDMTTKDADAAARRASIGSGSTPLVDVAALLAGLLDAKVRVTAGAERSRFVIEVPNADANRILAVLGAPAVA